MSNLYLCLCKQSSALSLRLLAWTKRRDPDPTDDFIAWMRDILSGGVKAYQSAEKGQEKPAAANEQVTRAPALEKKAPAKKKAKKSKKEESAPAATKAEPVK